MHGAARLPAAPVRAGQPRPEAESAAQLGLAASPHPSTARGDGVARCTRQEGTRAQGGASRVGEEGEKAAPPYRNSKTDLLSHGDRTFEIEASRLKLYLKSAAQKPATPRSEGRGIAAAPSSQPLPQPLSPVQSAPPAEVQHTAVSKPRAAEELLPSPGQQQPSAAPASTLG